MPTDGLSKRGTVPANKKRTRKPGTDKAVVEVVETPARPQTHHNRDVFAVCVMGLGVVVLITLAVGQGGLLGGGITGFFTTLFGKGAWAVPFALFFAGGCLLTGQAAFQAVRVAWGTLFLLLGALGVFAQPLRSDFFDPEAMRTSGGVLGAVMGWGGEALFGPARGVLYAVCLLAGLILCLERPLHEWADKVALFGRKPATPEVEEVETEVFDSPADALAEKRRRAAIEMLETPVTQLVEPVVERARPVAPKPRPVIHENNPVPFELDTDTEVPSEGYKLPPTSLLNGTTTNKKRDPKEIQKNIEILEDVLEQFNIEANVVEVANGPTITRYEVQLGPGIRVSRITALADNLAMGLAASHVRVEAPIPGKSAIGIEVPTSQRAMVTLREMIESLEFHDQQSKLTVALGRDVAGVARYTDLTRMPHLLIGGATNSGKSICMVSIIMSLIMKMSPKELRLVMIDPKRVELTLFEGLPHLMCPVVKDVKEAAGVLRAVVREMDRRYDKFSEAAVRNIDGWNEKANFQDKLPYIVVIVDELADLMIQCGNEVEMSICRLAQLARATGIHLVIATQRPSVDVITGTIKNNISSRVAFAVSSQIDSRTILDMPGAEKLIGKGDMLFLPIDQSKPVRIQGCYVGEKEIEEVCDFWRAQEKPQYVLNPIQIAIEDREGEMREQQASDPMWEEACRFVVERGEASTSMIQRKFAIGFQRASRMLDMMQERGIVGPRDGPRPREVLVDVVRLEQLLGNSAYMTPMDESEWIGD